MKTFHSLFLLSFISISALNAQVSDINTIDNSKKVIQIGMFEEKQNVDNSLKKFEKNQDLFVKPYKNLEIVYAVNIEKKDLTTTLKEIRNHYFDAFVNEKVYFKKPMTKMLMKPVVAKEDSRVNIIQVGMFEQRENLNESIKQFSDYNLMIKPYKNTHIVYVMDVQMDMIDEMLDNVQTKYSDAFVNKKIHLYKKPQQIKVKVIEKVVVTPIVQPEPKAAVVKVVKKPKINKPVDLDKLITSFENLPSAIYGRI